MAQRQIQLAMIHDDGFIVRPPQNHGPHGSIAREQSFLPTLCGACADESVMRLLAFGNTATEKEAIKNTRPLK